jgi:hypothetical protein
MKVHIVTFGGCPSKLCPKDIGLGVGIRNRFGFDYVVNDEKLFFLSVIKYAIKFRKINE